MCINSSLWSFNGKDIGFRLDSLHTILQQEVLLQEDVELIELLDPSILSAGQPQQQENGHLPTLCSLATPNIWYCLENIYPLFTFRVLVEEVCHHSLHDKGIINILAL